MGPRVLTRGNRMAKDIHDTFGPAFNGAAGFNPRKFTWSVFTTLGLTPFNGAAGFNPRKLLHAILHAGGVGILQWGRGF